MVGRHCVPVVRDWSLEQNWDYANFNEKTDVICRHFLSATVLLITTLFDSFLY